jgi:hypothetical protein
MSRLFRRTDDVFAAPLDGSTLLLNVTTGLYHGLNPVAARIWDLLAEPIDEDGLVATLVAEFDVAEEDCRREVAAFLSGLHERGLVTEDS